MRGKQWNGAAVSELTFIHISSPYSRVKIVKISTYSGSQGQASATAYPILLVA
jgi:hypothetical protein